MISALPFINNKPDDSYFMSFTDYYKGCGPAEFLTVGYNWT